MRITYATATLDQLTALVGVEVEITRTLPTGPGRYRRFTYRGRFTSIGEDPDRPGTFGGMLDETDAGSTGFALLPEYAWTIRSAGR